jgi:hypothetical protein
MTKQRTIAGFMTVLGLAVAAGAITLRSQPSGALSVFNADRGELKDAVPRSEAALRIKKPVRYEAIIENWRRFRSGN